MTPRAIQTRLEAARTRLILERPFIGSLVLHLPLVAADPIWCRTVATDARAFYFNARYIETLDFACTQFVLAHAALHCALGHFARRGHRERQRWDIATDHAVNMLLADDGLTATPGALLDPRYRGLSAEEIYPLIAPSPDASPLDRHLFDRAMATSQLPVVPHPETRPRGADPGRAPRLGATIDARGESCNDAGDAARLPIPHSAPMPAGPDPVAQQALAREWHGRLVAAAQRAKRAGRLGVSWRRALDALISPKLPWRALLAHYMMSVARDDYSFQRPSRRGGGALLPGLQGGAVELFLALDTSGSISSADLRQFTSEVDALKGQIRGRVTVHACDQTLDSDGPWIFEAWQPIAMPATLRGGGGTSFRPVFDWIERAHVRPDLLVYFTDAEGEFPEFPPGYPVVWLVKGGGKVPWGERIQLN